MNDLRTAAQQALLTLEWHLAHGAYGADIEGVTGALRAALAETVQEPVVWQCAECGGADSRCPHGRRDVPLYKKTCACTKKLQPLTTSRVVELWNFAITEGAALGLSDTVRFARALERAHGIGSGV